MIYIILITTHNIDYDINVDFFMQYEYQNIIAKNKKDDWSSIIFSFIITDCECHAGKEETHVTTR